MIKNITVIGATGLIGIPVTKSLVNAGFDVTVLVRDIEKAKKVLPASVNFIKGDLQSMTEINTAVRNADGIYINLNTTFNDRENDFNTEREGLDNLISVLKTSQVKQVAFLSSFLARDYKGSWWVMKMKKEAISKMKNSGLPYTIFYCASFMENLENSMRDGNKINTIGKPVSKLSWWIASEDFAKQVVMAFRTEKAIKREYSIQGIEGFTSTEAIKTYVENYNKEKLKVANLPMGFGKFLAIFIKPLKFAIPLIETINADNEKFEGENTWRELGKPQISLKSFAKR